MPGRELDRAWTARRQSDHRDALDSERVEQGRGQVRLLFGCTAVLDRRPEVAGPIRRQHLVAGSYQMLEEEPAVVADVASVEVQHHRTVAPDPVLDRTERGRRDLAVGRRLASHTSEPAAVPPPAREVRRASPTTTATTRPTQLMGPLYHMRCDPAATVSSRTRTVDPFAAVRHAVERRDAALSRRRYRRPERDRRRRRRARRRGAERKAAGLHLHRSVPPS